MTDAQYASTLRTMIASIFGQNNLVRVERADGDFEAYSDSAGAHQQGLDGRHWIEIHPIQVAQRRWRRFSTIAYDVICECGWNTKATYWAEAEAVANEHALLARGEVLRKRQA